VRGLATQVLGVGMCSVSWQAQIDFINGNNWHIYQSLMVLRLPEERDGLLEPGVAAMHHVHVPVVLPSRQCVKVDWRVLQLVLWGTVHVSLVIFCNVLIRVEVYTPNDLDAFAIMKVQLLRIAHLPSMILLVPRVS
jgi:hypothetical protein